VEKTLEKGYRTPDIYSEGCLRVGTQQMTDAIIKSLEEVWQEFY